MVRTPVVAGGGRLVILLFLTGPLLQRRAISAGSTLHFCGDCLLMFTRGHISPSHFRKINWLPVEHRVELCTSTTVFKYWKGIAPSYLNDMFMPSLNNYNTRLQMAFDIPLCRTNKGQKVCHFLDQRSGITKART